MSSHANVIQLTHAVTSSAPDEKAGGAGQAHFRGRLTPAGKRPCTDTAEGSRMVLCSEGGPADNWGWTLVIVLAVCAVMYVGIGIGYGVKVGGAPPGFVAHPHIDLWSQISGLVADGAAYARARVTANGGAQSGLREPLAAATPAAAPVDEGREKGTVAGDAGSGSAEEASDDELVE